jgi:predicted RNA binding protein YcfA (HicA-like mRNA interferase family)
MVKKLVDPVLARVLDRHGTVSFRDLQSLLTRLGFSLKRTKGSHFIYNTHARPER